MKCESFLNSEERQPSNIIKFNTSALRVNLDQPVAFGRTFILQPSNCLCIFSCPTRVRVKWLLLAGIISVHYNTGIGTVIEIE